MTLTSPSLASRGTSILPRAGASSWQVQGRGGARSQVMMKSSTITGGAGVRLQVTETGNASGRPLLFIHGFSQCSLSWQRQMHSDLAEAFRLVALDLRGHGLSDKPREGYADSRLWADDINAVIRTLDLDRPILCGWSYGPLVILDYIRHYGEAQIGGINFVGGITKLGSEAALAALDPRFLNWVPGFFSSDAEESVRALEALLTGCFGDDLSATERWTMLGFNVAVPPFVRQALFSRAFDNDDLLPQLRSPVLITHGARDAVVKPAVIEQQMATIRHARIHVIPDAEHACFWTAAQTYNALLRQFANERPE
jgi:pimeloyl-ACP methyl ester carboxylesterase